jgi:hypothetical protein
MLAPYAGPATSSRKPRVCPSSAKLVREGFEFKVRTLDDTYDGLVKYGKALGILPVPCSSSS